MMSQTSEDQFTIEEQVKQVLNDHSERTIRWRLRLESQVRSSLDRWDELHEEVLFASERMLNILTSDHTVESSLSLHDDNLVLTCKGKKWNGLTGHEIILTVIRDNNQQNKETEGPIRRVHLSQTTKFWPSIVLTEYSAGISWEDLRTLNGCTGQPINPDDGQVERNLESMFALVCEYTGDQNAN
jgi:hypothetical protein